MLATKKLHNIQIKSKQKFRCKEYYKNTLEYLIASYVNVNVVVSRAQAKASMPCLLYTSDAADE